MDKRIKINPYLVTLLFFAAAGLAVVAITMKRSGAGAPDKFGIGRRARPDEIRLLDIDVRPDGKGLPAGSGNVESGKLIYNAKCVACHGKGEKTEDPLPGEALFVNFPAGKTKTIGTYWPYATTIFDYVRRAMPYSAPGSLTNQEVYHLTAYLLYRNHIISAQTVINEKSLPGIVMPAKKRYVDDDREGGDQIR
jgi:mono/diheme cytochrome c family protein